MRLCFLVLSLLLYFLPGCCPGFAATNVSILRVPEEGIQPQALVDNEGVLHLLYFKGEAKHGNLYYTKRPKGKDSKFCAPIPVNSVDGSAVAKGTIRGAQMALGRQGQVFVTWNASDKVAGNLHAVLFSRLNTKENKFEEERNLLNINVEIDGGGSVAADKNGNVLIFFHAAEKGKSDCFGRVYMMSSKDDGKTFSQAEAIDSVQKGSCACCSLKALIDDNGHIYVSYRAAGEDKNRDATLLVSKDKGKSFSSQKLEAWEINACPMTMFFLSKGYNDVLSAWETRGSVSFKSLKSNRQVSVSGGEPLKYPTAAANAKGETLFSWVEGAGWNKGGNACYRLYGREAKPLSPQQTQAGVKPWSFTAVAASSDGDFFLIY